MKREKCVEREGCGHKTRPPFPPALSLPRASSVFCLLGRRLFYIALLFLPTLPCFFVAVWFLGEVRDASERVKMTRPCCARLHPSLSPSFVLSRWENAVVLDFAREKKKKKGGETNKRPPPPHSLSCPSRHPPKSAARSPWCPQFRPRRSTKSPNSGAPVWRVAEGSRVAPFKKERHGMVFLCVTIFFCGCVECRNERKQKVKKRRRGKGETGAAGGGARAGRRHTRAHTHTEPPTSTQLHSSECKACPPAAAASWRPRRRGRP